MDSNISMVYQFQLQPCKTAINVQTPSRNDKIAGLRNVYQNFYMFHTRHGCLGSWFSVHRKSRNCSNPWAGFSFRKHLLWSPKRTRNWRNRLSTTSTLIKFTIFDLNTGKVKSKRFKESFVKSKTMKEKESEVN